MGFAGIIDSTLREGVQAPGVHLGLEQRLRIASLLDRVGIEELELGIASRFDELCSRLFTACRARGIRAQLALWCRCRAEDINLAVRLRPDVLSLSIPASDLHLRERLGKDRNWALKQLTAGIGLAREMGIKKVSVGLEDATRTDGDFLEQLGRVAAKHGAFRVRLADTVGLASPAKMAKLVTLFSKLPLKIGVHTHNDFGMATANAVAAIEAGAHWADTTVLGLGERSGCCRLEELAGYLSLVTRDREYKTRLLPELSRYTARAAQRSIPAQQPLVGSSIFTCESGLHLQGLTRNPATYEPYAPEAVNASRSLQIGSKSGRRAVSDRLRLLGHEPDEATLSRCLPLIRQHALRNRRPVTDQELCTLAVSGHTS